MKKRYEQDHRKNRNHKSNSGANNFENGYKRSTGTGNHGMRKKKTNRYGFLLPQFILVAAAAMISRFSASAFFLILILGEALLMAVMIFFAAGNVNTRRKKGYTGKKPNPSASYGSRRIRAADEGHYTAPGPRGNFNIVIEERKKIEEPVIQDGHEVKKTAADGVSDEDGPKVRYRSPFEPFWPFHREKKQETQKGGTAASGEAAAVEEAVAGVEIVVTDDAAPVTDETITAFVGTTIAPVKTTPDDEAVSVAGAAASGAEQEYREESFTPEPLWTPTVYGGTAQETGRIRLFEPEKPSESAQPADSIQFAAYEQTGEDCSGRPGLLGENGKVIRLFPKRRIRAVRPVLDTEEKDTTVRDEPDVDEPDEGELHPGGRNVDETDLEEPEIEESNPDETDGSEPVTCGAEGRQGWNSAEPEEYTDIGIESVAREYIKNYTYPPADLLAQHVVKEDDQLAEIHTELNAKKLVETLSSFGVGARVINISRGPAVTRYEIQPNAGVKVSRIVSLSDDIALNLEATGVRIEAPIPGKAAVGIEIPNREVTPVFLREVIESREFQEHPSKLAFAVGKDIAGRTIVADISRMPHLLIAGATGSGKSVCINTLIASLLYKARPDEVKLLMIDPKVVELSIYNGIPHLLIPVVTDPKKAAGALGWAVTEMTNRYKLFADNNVRDLKGYNGLPGEKRGQNTLPHIVIIIDELADLMMVAPDDVEDRICRLAQMARAAGMHLIIATQRPSVDIITGVIKANIPSRISFAVSSQIDSRTILDMGGAEKLQGRGDMLFSPIGEPKPVRVQGGFISDKEVEAIVSCLKSEAAGSYDEEVMEKIENQTSISQTDAGDNDELLSQAIEVVLEIGQASTSLIQRKLKVGYSRAARMLDQMETRGIVSGQDGSKPRQVLITVEEWKKLKED